MILRFFIIAILVFASFRILNFLSERIQIPFWQKNKLQYIFPVLELFGWLTYLLWIVKVIYDSRNYFALISISVVFLLIAYPLFVMIRDFISGIILKLQNKIVEGRYIELEEIKGIVKKAGPLMIDIEDNHGNIISYNYNQFRGKRILRTSNNQNLEKVTIAFEFPEKRKINEFLSDLKKEMMNTPWTAMSQPPIIENTKVENGKLLVEVGAFTLDKSYAEDIRAMVISGLGDKLNQSKI